MLSISQLAAHAGVTVRPVRHYRQRGLLAEPARDASGYRRYDAQAVVDLIRIKTLSDAGVPLARIDELLGAEPGEFAEAVTEIDRALAQKIADLTHHRRKIAELTGGERLFLPPEIVSILDRMRALGVSERTVQIERDAWILVAALSPEPVAEWAAVKDAALDDPEFQRLYLACDEAFDWDPADPRLVELAADMARWATHSRPELEGDPPPGTGVVPVVLTLMNSHVAGSSPAWQRLGELSQDPEILRHQPEPA